LSYESSTETIFDWQKNESFQIYNKHKVSIGMYDHIAIMNLNFINKQTKITFVNYNMYIAYLNKYTMINMAQRKKYILIHKLLHLS
jgi:hypothetical protein